MDPNTTPSLVTPASAEDARAAVVAQLHRQMLESGQDYYMVRTFQRPYVAEGDRTPEQARWLEDARRGLEKSFTAWLDAQ